MTTSNKNFKVKNGLDVAGAIGVGSTPEYGSSGQVLTSQGTGSAPIWATVSSSGLTSSDYVAQGRLTGDTSVTPNSDLVIPFVDDFDPNNWWDATNKRFQPTIAGYYNITLQVWWTIAAVTNNQTNIQIRKSGNTIAISQLPTNTNNAIYQNATKLAYLNGTTDYIDFTAYTGNSSAQSLQWGGNSNGQGTFFSAALLTAGKGDKGDKGDPGDSGLADIISDTTPQLGGDLDTNGYDITNLNALTLDTTPTGVPSSAGTISWDADLETVALQINNSVTLQVGQEHVIRVKNNSGSVAIPNGTVVMFAGATGDTVKVTPAISTSANQPYLLVGVTTQEIPADGFGFVTQFGFVNGVNTNSWTLGDLLYVDPSTPGALTNSAPSAPNWTFPIAAVTKVNASSGRILVRTIPGSHLHDIVDVAIATPGDNEVVAYDSSSGTWKNQDAAQAGLAESGHIHDDRYYTESETDSLLNDKANLSHTHAISDVTSLSTTLADKLNISDAPEVARDAVASALVADTGITITPNDGLDTITVAVDTNAIQPRVANVTDTEIGYLDGVTSSVQDQIDLKAPLDSPALIGDASAVNLTVTGDLIVQGSTTTVSATNLEVTDSLIYLSADQYDTDAVDIGIFGAYGDANPGHAHTGLIRDASDSGKWKLVSNAAEPVSNVVDFTGVTYDTLVAGTVEANLTGTATKATAAGYYVSGTGTSYASPTDTTRIFIGQGQPATAPTGGFKTGDIWIGW